MLINFSFQFSLTIIINNEKLFNNENEKSLIRLNVQQKKNSFEKKGTKMCRTPLKLLPKTVK